MSTFIAKNDYRPMMKHLDAIIDADDLILEEAETIAVAQVKDYLFQLYDTDAIFSKTGAERHAYLVRCCCNIVLKILFERLSVDMPKVIEQNYSDTLDYLERLADSKIAADLPKRLNDKSEPRTQTRWGSQPKRSHG
jgi:phage gp36-like protein